MEANHRYFVLRPAGQHKTYRLRCYTNDHGKRIYVQLDTSTADAVAKINTRFQAKLLQPHEVELLLKELIAKKYAKFGVQHKAIRDARLSEINQKLLEQYWNEVYGPKYLADEASMRRDLLRSVAAIEPLSLYTATESELQRAIKKHSSNVIKIRRIVARLNQLLVYAGRNFKLKKPPEPRLVVQHVTLNEFRLLHAKLSGSVADLAMCLMASGLRIGEALALQLSDYRDGAIHVNKQLTEKGEVKPPKRGSIGAALVFEFGHAATKRWCAVTDKRLFRNYLKDALATATRQVWANNRTKWVSAHDLRHSYAIHYLAQGASLKIVAMSLRNKEAVCEKYYLGYSHTASTLEAGRQFMRTKICSAALVEPRLANLLPFRFAQPLALKVVLRIVPNLVQKLG